LTVDTQASTPVAVDKNGSVSMKRALEKTGCNVCLWKDHTAVREAAEINNFQVVGGKLTHEK